MFKNIPDRLVKAIKDIPAEERVFPMRYLIPAGLVTVEYLRKNPTGPGADEFFDFKRQQDGSVAFEHSVRVIMIGETIFLLRSQPGFPEFCRRFQSRDFRSTFFELFAARMFLRGNFELHAKPETGVKGEDFDFRAVGPADSINVEVTALTAPAFSVQTLENALNAKRKQLPNDAPAVLVCVYPESWFSIGPELVRFGLMHTAYQFFSRTKRVNAIAFVSEQHWDHAGDGTLGALFVTHFPIANSTARHRISSLDFLFNVSRDSPRSIVKRNNLEKDAASFQNSEFYRWVDALFGT